TTVHDICMWKRCQNFVAGEGAGSSAYEKDVKTSSRGEGAGSSVCSTLPRPLPNDKVSSFSQTQIWSPYHSIPLNSLVGIQDTPYFKTAHSNTENHAFQKCCPMQIHLNTG